jgi:predicted Fe-Mo cluster-binding NifX family protein
MKVAISANSEKIDEKIADVFGRCPFFIVAEIENDEIKNTRTIKNNNAVQTGGAGISSAQLIAENDIQALITKNVGPRAMDVLNQFNIKVYSGEGIAKDLLDRFIKKELTEITNETGYTN